MMPLDKYTIEELQVSTDFYKKEYESRWNQSQEDSYLANKQYIFNQYNLYKEMLRQKKLEMLLND